MKRAARFFVFAVFACTAFWLLYTLYCLSSVTDLCKLKKDNPKSTAFMELREKQWKRKDLHRKIQQQWVPLSAISQYLKTAVVLTEDPNFYHHYGLDFVAIRRAMRTDFERRQIVSGASTITQQLMKNLYLSPSQNPFRKWREVILALRVERCLKKDRILEIYLNVIEWGERTYGIAAASRRYFGKSASQLDPAESALLTAMIPNPVYYSPYKRNPKLFREKNSVLKLMWKSGRLSKGQYEESVREAILLR